MTKHWRLGALPLSALVLSALLAGCTSLESRDGYRVDHGHPSSAHDSRVSQLILHYTHEDEATSLSILTGPRVSSHYLLPVPARQGEQRVYQLVDESRRAWHAGASHWRGQSGLNATSIGIEIVNAGPERGADQPRWAPYPDAQIDTLIALLRDIAARHDIAPDDILGHADVAPERKVDPGPAFPWKRLHEAGIGAWPDTDEVAHYRRRFATRPPDLTTFQQALAEWGYTLPASGRLDERTRAVLRAFQMHFRPADYRGRPDIESAARLWALLAKYRPEALARLESQEQAAELSR
ncbi:N-acetylmuramoyl-L-alanine amidase [Halomonas elongata]|uniref:N-acetylmuramoyl-L-alanine amidase n=1 Tax=Halomonas elongata (strain ATCC 33173 / DSM 2581 / NBRC 15536 / NCIMB 2198 / 1H9) TaxID=768066 RepID=E1VBD5_HALED|nr:N-acetylmuramoyl-L-alanine amidase [Halomonas elongata]WBF19473.1 N-acetylmuramoyl-L-alanine amidase [Halomonas elongata]WPU48334.1 N-acetylmuramoyl-L-alanine amidase [Halomonas elongata DSM 2581]CBV42196.1 N-acetylmuramoyl-L-alanine amidase AmiD [Halomonas elongata DSM 2581]